MAHDSGSDDKDGDAEHVERADVGGTDWLLQQLGGGRESRKADAPRGSGDERNREAAGTSDVPASADRNGVPAEPDAAPPTTASPKLRWSWASGTVEPIEQASAEQASDTVPDASTGATSQQRPDLPAAPGTGQREPVIPATFNWALTPTDDVDPLVARSSPPVSPASPHTNESRVGDENDYFHPALPIPGGEPEVPAETTEVPVAAAETTQIPVAEAETTQIPVAAAETTEVPVAAAETTQTPAAASAPSSSGNSGGPNKRTTRILFFVAGGLLVVLVLIALYVFGTQIPGFVSAAPTPTPTATKTSTPTPTPTPTAQATGPQAPGVHAWDTLRGGECINPFSSPWALKFTVVDCATPHAAQLVYTNVFTSDPAAAFPGDAQLASQINLLCTKPGIINLDAAGAFTDAQIQGAYPATEKQWKGGQRSYFCFVNRAGGEPLTGSIAGPGPAA